MVRRTRSAAVLEKARSGIPGLDEITNGGLPRGRVSLVCGGAGCGKTLMGIQFLVRGAIDLGEPGAFLAFEETAEDLAKNVSSLGFDLEKLVRDNLLSVDHVRLDRSEILETGEYDLEGLFLRLNLAIESVGAKRVVIDTLETLFGGLSNEAILRSELVRLFRWLKHKEMTAVVTAERGNGSLTRHGLEEYVSDCVILLDHRVSEQISTRRLRVVKYRGSLHGSNEYPFLIDDTGIHVVPITSAGLAHEVSEERLSTGIPRLDRMLGGQGVYRGSTILVSGTAGTGKTSIGAHFVDAACRRGESCLFFTFEESPQQILRNMRSIGIELERWVKKGLLRFTASRPTVHGLEMHLALIHKAVEEIRPSVVVLDPISNLARAGSGGDAHLMLVRLIDLLKSRGTTALMTTLTGGGRALEETNLAVSSLVDTWLLLQTIESQGERNRGLYVMKSRGTAHSNQIREFLVTSRGIELLDVYTGPEGVVTGSARLAREARETAARTLREQEIERKLADLERRRSLAKHQIRAIRSEFQSHEEEVLAFVGEARAAERELEQNRRSFAELRGADPHQEGNSGRRSRRERDAYGKEVLRQGIQPAPNGEKKRNQQDAGETQR